MASGHHISDWEFILPKNMMQVDYVLETPASIVLLDNESQPFFVLEPSIQSFHERFADNSQLIVLILVHDVVPESSTETELVK
jgi:hypothetical protein